MSLTSFGDGHGVSGARPLAPEPEFLVGEALQLQCICGAPLQARVRVEVVPFLNPAADGLDRVGQDDDYGSHDQGQAETESIERGVCGAADLLCDVRVS